MSQNQQMAKTAFFFFLNRKKIIIYREKNIVGCHGKF